ncbi:hypothetical protein [Streptomyces sp. NBRC 110028]|uniref:hypothetical protein n=1 Tax=Streptomyces sp. NBRC 110028 TaxID=1621260 RepID=UPI001F180002|nr:hypothetical protein [Streptomyces sp. NBRC 110028]
MAAVTALAIGGAGAAEATGGGTVQGNRCDNNSLLGEITIAGTTDITNETECVNYAKSGVAEQSNRCRTNSVIGPVNISLAPGTDITHRTNCINYVESGDGVRKQTNRCRTTSLTGPINIAAPGNKITTETNCIILAGDDDPENGEKGGGNGEHESR